MVNEVQVLPALDSREGTSKDGPHPHPVEQTPWLSRSVFSSAVQEGSSGSKIGCGGGLGWTAEVGIR